MNKGKINYIKSAISTNDILLNYPETLGDYTSIYTDNQTAGRGTRGNSWQEDNGKGLAFSTVLQLDTSQLSAVSLVSGLAIRRALLDTVGIDTQLKWSNDILAGKKKLAGILCESKIFSSDNVRMVVGVGINIAHNQEDFDERSLPYATSLALEGIHPQETAEIAEGLRSSLERYLKIFKTEGFEKKLLAEYVQNCYTINKEVYIIEGSSKKKAIAQSVNPDGSLACLIDGESKAVYSGQVSVRGIYGYVD